MVEQLERSQVQKYSGDLSTTNIEYSGDLNQTPYDLNNELLVCYSGHSLNDEPFGNLTILHHLNTKLVRYSDPYCTQLFEVQISHGLLDRAFLYISPVDVLALY